MSKTYRCLHDVHENIWHIHKCHKKAKYFARVEDKFRPLCGIHVKKYEDVIPITQLAKEQP